MRVFHKFLFKEVVILIKLIKFDELQFRILIANRTTQQND